MANPGKMDRRLTVQVRTYTRDAAGGRVQTWADSYGVWAELVTTKHTQGEEAGAEREIGDKSFRIRYRSDIGAGTHRVLYQLKFHDILGIDQEGRKGTLLLSCKSIQALSI